MDIDDELHKAWIAACMDVAQDFAEEYCNMQCDGERSHLEAATAHRTKLRNMLWDVPASMALTDRVAELRDALQSLSAVARRYLPNYDEHPEIQKADEALDARPCTCHPDDNPPQPCAKQYALGECMAAAAHVPNGQS